jgi:hypothetical protein
MFKTCQNVSLPTCNPMRQFLYIVSNAAILFIEEEGRLIEDRVANLFLFFCQIMNLCDMNFYVCCFLLSNRKGSMSEEQ